MYDVCSDYRKIGNIYNNSCSYNQGMWIRLIKAYYFLALVANVGGR